MRINTVTIVSVALACSTIFYLIGKSENKNIDAPDRYSVIKSDILMESTPGKPAVEDSLIRIDSVTGDTYVWHPSLDAWVKIGYCGRTWEEVRSTMN